MDETCSLGASNKGFPAPVPGCDALDVVGVEVGV